MELGWDHVTWEENEPPDAMDNTWSALSPAQQGWATLLGYGDASWNEGAAAVAAEEAAAEKPETKAEPYSGTMGALLLSTVADEFYQRPNEWYPTLHDWSQLKSGGISLEEFVYIGSGSGPLRRPLKGIGPNPCPNDCQLTMDIGYTDCGYRMHRRVWDMLSEDTYFLQLVPAQLRADKAFMYHVILTFHADWPLNHASSELREDRDLLAVSFAMCGEFLQYQAPEVQALHADPDFMLKVVSMKGVALKYASPFLRGNRRVVTAAVSSMGGALVYASEELQNDRTIVTIATAQLGTALHMAAPALRQSCGDSAILADAQRMRDMGAELVGLVGPCRDHDHGRRRQVPRDSAAPQEFFAHSWGEEWARSAPSRTC